ncbi:hypothetical protein [Klebsiella phage 05F01]|nr:hypothetical protein [Klebsiella phage 05F01]
MTKTKISYRITSIGYSLLNGGNLGNKQGQLMGPL